MLERIVFVRRQSPDWAKLATDFRAGRKIDPKRFVPDHDVPGFPANVDRMIAIWNKKFAVDYFTCRAAIAHLSKQNILAVPNSLSFSYLDQREILELTRNTEFLLFFHDDDDFFSDIAFEQTARAASEADADTYVFPLFRVHTELFTFVREGEQSTFVWGEKRNFDFRFQSNNYGVNSRVLSANVLQHMKDHVEASRFANERGFTERYDSTPISATVKTPCSASVLSKVVRDANGLRKDMLAFSARFTAPDLPPSYAWLADPLQSIAAIFEAAARGGYDQLPKSHMESRPVLQNTAYPKDSQRT